MITNERQYRITNAELKRFEDSLAAQTAAGPSPDVHPRIHQAMLEALASERDELRAQLERYDDLRSGRVAQRTLNSLRELPIALIEARIAARLTQRELAKRLGVVEQQVQRWEANDYAGVGLDRLQEIADALGVQVHETITYAVPALGALQLRGRRLPEHGRRHRGRVRGRPTGP